MTMSEKSELTPMVRQYMEIRKTLPEDIILFYRLGDFYEMFFEDAVRAAPILGVALTQRAGSPLCGVPFHAVDGYVAKVIRAGLKVAICEQAEDPREAKGIVKREISRIITPGTVMEEEILDSASNNYIASVVAPFRSKNPFGVALLDLSTGDFFVEEFSSVPSFLDAISRYAPKEWIMGGEASLLSPLKELEGNRLVRGITKIEDRAFLPEIASRELLNHFQVHSLDGFGLNESSEVVSAAGAILWYVKYTLLRSVNHIKAIRLATESEYLKLDETTCLNLDLVPVRSRPKENTLLGVLDVTQTPMGARALKTAIQHPFGTKAKIDERLNAVSKLLENRIMASSLRATLGRIRDIERLIARIGSEVGNGRDLKALSTSLTAMPSLKAPLAESGDPLLERISFETDPLPGLVGLLEDALCELPPIGVRDGGIIRDGYSKELDEYRRLAQDGRSFLAEYQAKEQERTGIKTLKVRHNKVFGFYIEISKGQAALAPSNYERRQTLVNAERFVTPELKEYEEKIFGAQEKADALEYEIFITLRKEAAAKTGEIQKTARAIAELDLLLALAERAMTLGYVRPQIEEGDELRIEGGRHPVIEQLNEGERFVPNDTLLDCRDNQIAIITGPNMAGKSTYIRQVAIITIMAHIGSYVPAAFAKIPVTDRVFTRVGAGDDIAKGRSTFMVEMQETANILNNATKRSLIVLDEIGRGTSTFDGISIAWAVAEHLHNEPSVKAKTLFATHYHELTDLELQLPGVKNYSVKVHEKGDTIVFLRTIARGAADKSYGIQVARLAGLPAPVVKRAKEILGNLEDGELDASAQPKLAKKSRKKIDFDEEVGQLHLFDI